MASSVQVLIPTVKKVESRSVEILGGGAVRRASCRRYAMQPNDNEALFTAVLPQDREQCQGAASDMCRPGKWTCHTTAAGPYIHPTQR